MIVETHLDPNRKMVSYLHSYYNFRSHGVCSAMLQIPREEFVPADLKRYAYEDGALDIGFGQTVSQPYTVAFMTDLFIKVLPGKSRSKVLEIGTGSGYQAAVLSKLVRGVYTIEIIPELAKRASDTFKKLGIRNIEVKIGNGCYGWPQKAPFDGIIITAGVKGNVPEVLFSQLKENGVLVAPVGTGPNKIMVRITKKKGMTASDMKDPTSLKLRGAWKEFGVFNFVPFVQAKK